MSMDFMGMMCDVWNEEARNNAKKDLAKAIEDGDKKAEEEARQKIRECNACENAALIYESMRD